MAVTKTAPTQLKPGKKAPSFRAVDQDGNPFQSKDLLGKKWVLFFYPADLTPTCTVEACNLRDHFKQLKKAGYEVVGISKGDAASKKKFAEKHDLPYRLLADEQLTIAAKFGVFGEKLFMGKVIEGIFRTTFVIDEEGKIERIIDQVKSKIAAEQILEGKG
ncbi:MAG TPA: thioredoxin-dependent thiol peroxidase [Bacteroidetes bacterium]|jgi:thioredoxin-dependent peroxiredoxin|nr:MAG: thiol peroxidase [Sphingobacteriales bacterium BACL12 MAG-120813-bin55]HCK20806.1 thioredoxin-dependent thiol peroxidase [Bacteroidota bacterium]